MSHHIHSLGKSTFLKYALARLLSEQEVVLLCDNLHAYLFYRGTAYFQHASLGFLGLPVHKEHPTRAVWTPIDVDYQTHGPPIRAGIWPIQASSPKPTRWKSWVKQLDGALWGMPLWSLKELIRGYAFSSFYRPLRGSSLILLHLRSIPFSPNYNTLQRILEEHLSQPDGLTAPDTGDPKVDAILEILHREMEREKVAAAAAAAVEAEEAAAVAVEAEEAAAAGEEEEEVVMEQYSGELGDDTAMDQDQDMVNQVDQAPPQRPVPKEKMDHALEILVRTATEEFCFIPRDVYRGILDLPEARGINAGALNVLDYSKLQTLIKAFTSDKELDLVSHRLVVVFPTENRTTSDVWKVDFKSIQVAELAVKAMRKETDAYQRDIFNGLRGLPDGSVLAGRIFEEIAHRVFCEGTALRCYATTSNTEKIEPPPTFYASTVLSPQLSPISGPRDYVPVDFKGELSNVTLDGAKYYIPTMSNHPLFDSFIIDAKSRPAVISIFQITIASKHEGSSMGYLHVRRLKTHVRQLFREKGLRTLPDIKVRYFLVCPEDGLSREWQMPTGWGKGKKNTHRGDVFCIYIPSPRLMVRHICSLLSSPNRITAGCRLPVRGPDLPSIFQNLCPRLQEKISLALNHDCRVDLDSLYMPFLCASPLSLFPPLPLPSS